MGFKLTSPVYASVIAAQLGLVLSGCDRLVTNVAAFEEAHAGSLIFSTQERSVPTSCILIGIVPIVYSSDSEGGDDGCVLASNTPRLDFIRALDYLASSVGFASYRFPSVIHPTVILGANVVVEAGCYIDEGAILEHNVVIHRGTRIGKYTRIRANSSIGGDGFGFERLSDGAPIRFVHLGGVSIGNNVEIGSNTCVVRGSLSDTIIEDNVKIDNLVHIAHNCHIEAGAFIIACAEISGGVRVERNAWVGPNASIIQKVRIGREALVGLGAVVTKDVNARSVYAGNPARLLRSIESS